ncbi:AI-2E family transporter [Sulfuritalea sp.]|uniref:AI-2E family transporter n=1 Tax=Sulfuritalea sp. TaxID=2480090 RepID=UPI00286E0877|nr:AI-2E family transporter [Sulfuritalea sp.]
MNGFKHAPATAGSAHNSSGPVVWAAIIAATCLLLLVFQKMLWLVVPFLLALILYYFLYPPVKALIYRGMSRDAAASVVTLVFLALLVIVGVALMPWVARQIVDWQNTVERYAEGGMRLLDASLRALEAHWPTLARAHLADTVAARLTQGAGSVGDHLEPIAIGIMAWTPSLLLAPFLAFFFLRDGRRFKRFLSAAVPNAFFEKTLFLLHEIDRTSRAYFQGLINLTVLDALTLAAGLWLLGIPGPLALGLICAVLAWVPYVGSILGGLLVVLVAATDFPDAPGMAYWAVALFIGVRLLDDFVYMPLTIGKSLELHPLVTVLMIFVGGAVAGVSGLMLVLPVLGVVMVIGETIGLIVTDPRLMARHRYARALRREQASNDL